MKKTNKVSVSVIVAVFAAVCISGYFLYNSINYGPVKAKDTVSIKTLSVSDAKLIAHRGFSAIAPENTLFAFEEAGNAGFFGCEFDIHLTGDNEWVVMHDSKIRKMTGAKGKIEKMTVSQLKAFPLKNGANIDKYGKMFIPTLEETLEIISKYQLSPIIEIKTDTTRCIEEIISLAKKYGLSEKVWIISFYEKPLIRLRELDKSIKISLLVHKTTEEAVEFCLKNDINGIDFNIKKNKEKQVQKIINSGLIAQAWTVDKIEDFEKFYSYGVRYFTGNCLTY